MLKSKEYPQLVGICEMAGDPEGAAVLETASVAGAAVQQPQRAARSRRSFFLFSVRGLLLVILVIGCGLGWIAHVVRTGETQRRAVAAVYRAGGWVVYDTDWDARANPSAWTPRWPKPVIDRLGIDYFGNVVFVNLHDRGTDDVLAQVARFHSLRQLHRPGFTVTDAGLVHLAGLQRLQFLSLDDTLVTDAGLAHLKNLKGLKWLKLKGTRVTAAGIAELKKSLPGLQVLR